MVELVRAGSFSVGGSGLSAEAPLSFESTPRIARVGSGSHWRTAVLTEPGTWSWKLTVPSGGSLHLGVEVFGPDGATPPTMEAVVAVVSPERRKVVRVVSPQELDSPGWLDLTLDLARWSGDEVICEVSTRVLDVEARPMPGVELAWSPTRVVSSDARRAGKAPNIVLVVIDTLRYDFLSAYGAGRWASPRMASTLERRGAVFEQAYAQAPWTLPSMISLMTGTHPAEILGRDPAAYAVPTDLVTLPERLQHAGYETAAFIGNPTLHHGNGFARGLGELYISPAENAFVSSIEDEVITLKASSWLGSRGSAPFFLYVHYLAPMTPIRTRFSSLVVLYVAPSISVVLPASTSMTSFSVPRHSTIRPPIFAIFALSTPPRFDTWIAGWVVSSRRFRRDSSKTRFLLSLPTMAKSCSTTAAGSTAARFTKNSCECLYWFVGTGRSSLESASPHRLV